jgi:hypothetical protein
MNCLGVVKPFVHCILSNFKGILCDYCFKEYLIKNFFEKSFYFVFIKERNCQNVQRVNSCIIVIEIVKN